MLHLDSVDISLECQPGEVLKIISHYSIINLDINSLLPKIDEIFLIAKSIKTDITGIFGVKLDDLFFQPKIQVENHMFSWDRDCNSDCVTYYVQNNLS